MAVTTIDNPRAPSDVQLWAGVLMGPLGWIVDEGLSYALTQHACSTGHVYVLHVVTISGLIIALLGAALAWRQWSLVREGSEEGGSIRDRSFWMARLGVALGLGFSVVIVALAVPTILLPPCS